LSIDDTREQVEIFGTTLLVYWYLLKKGQSCGVREIQRALGFSSSSSAHYHLEKLTSKDILTKDPYGNYRINGKIKVGRISPFIFVHGFVVPTQLAYALATTVMCLLFLAFSWKFLNMTIVLALSPGIVASIIFWLDTIRVWRTLPSFKRSVR
jgi:hypothetical protein